MDQASPPPYDVEQAWEQLAAGRSAKVRKLKWINYAAAAAGILILLSALWFLWPRPATVLLTQTGEQQNISLPDASTVRLNVESRLSFNESGWNKNRLVQLNGEAFFSVSEGAAFTVTTDNGDVSVLGTEFNVWSRGSFIEVSCYEGRVRVSRDGNEKELGPGMEASWKNEQWVVQNSILSSTSPPWTQGRLRFKAAPLSRVLQELQHHYNVEVTLVGDPGRSYSGGFPTNDLEAAIRNISEPLGLEVQRVGDQQLIFRE